MRQRRTSPTKRTTVPGTTACECVPRSRSPSQEGPPPASAGRAPFPKRPRGVVGAGSSRGGEHSPEARVWVVRLFLEELWQTLKSPKEKVQLFCKTPSPVETTVGLLSVFPRSLLAHSYYEPNHLLLPFCPLSITERTL